MNKDTDKELLQRLMNLGTLVVFAVGAWWFSNVSEDLRKLHTLRAEMDVKISETREHFANSYARKDELERSMQRVMDRLDRIEAILTNKADRREGHQR